MKDFSERQYVKRGGLWIPEGAICRMGFNPAFLGSFPKPTGTPTFPTGADGDWRFNNDLTDSSGNGNSMSVTGTTAYAADDHGTSNKALSLDGSSFAALSSSSVGNYTSLAFTVLAFVKPTSISGSPVIVNHGSFASTGYYLQFASDGHVEFQIGRGSAPTSAKVVTASSLISTGNWYGVVVVINGSSGQIWVNGINRTSSSDTLSAPSSDSNNFRVGSYFNGSNKLTGSVAQVAIWGRVLNSTEIANICALGSL